MALFGLKLWENAFQTIPDISLFDAQSIKKHLVFENFERPFNPEDGSVQLQTLGKCVSDYLRHLISRRRKKELTKNSATIIVGIIFVVIFIFGREQSDGRPTARSD